MSTSSPRSCDTCKEGKIEGVELARGGSCEGGGGGGGGGGSLTREWLIQRPKTPTVADAVHDSIDPPSLCPPGVRVAPAGLAPPPVLPQGLPFHRLSPTCLVGVVADGCCPVDCARALRTVIKQLLLADNYADWEYLDASGFEFGVVDWRQVVRPQPEAEGRVITPGVDWHMVVALRYRIKIWGTADAPVVEVVHEAGHLDRFKQRFRAIAEALKPGGLASAAVAPRTRAAHNPEVGAARADSAAGAPEPGAAALVALLDSFDATGSGPETSDGADPNQESPVSLRRAFAGRRTTDDREAYEECVKLLGSPVRDEVVAALVRLWDLAAPREWWHPLTGLMSHPHHDVARLAISLWHHLLDTKGCDSSEATLQAMEQLASIAAAPLNLPTIEVTRCASSLASVLLLGPGTRTSICAVLPHAAALRIEHLSRWVTECDERERLLSEYRNVELRGDPPAVLGGHGAKVCPPPERRRPRIAKMSAKGASRLSMV